MSNTPKDNPPFPVQPVVIDPHGTYRFKENRIVSTFREKAGTGQKYDLNDAATDYHKGLYTREEMCHFAQLIGYSVSGWSDLSYVTDRDYGKAQTEVKRMKKRVGIE